MGTMLAIIASALLVLSSLMWAKMALAEGEPVLVHRFYSETLRHHFYTASEAEKTSIMNRYAQNVWRYEGSPFRVYGPENCTGKDVVHRFWSSTLRAHFYTMNVVEKDEIIRRYPPEVWNYEGIGFCAYKESAGSDRIAVHRFWSPLNRSHFYTASEVEMKHVRENYPESVWTYEGISFYVLPTAL
jgi:hypothetical protein